MSFPIYVLSGALIAAATAAGVIATRQQRGLAVAVALAGATMIAMPPSRTQW